LDDLNTPKAIAVLWQMVKEPASKDVYTTALEMDKVFSLDLCKELAQVEVPKEIQELAEKRLEAKKNKDWAMADSLREKIAQMGWAILDTKDGFDLKPK
jgi:cysteinyl-tRNA synthetase